MQSWNVHLNGTCIDIVFFSKDCDEEYVRNCLINKEGFDPSIKVSRGI